MVPEFKKLFSEALYIVLEQILSVSQQRNYKLQNNFSDQKLYMLIEMSSHIKVPTLF